MTFRLAKSVLLSFLFLNSPAILCQKEAHAQTSQNFVKGQVVIKLNALTASNLSQLISRVRPLGAERISSILHPDSVLTFSSGVSANSLNKFVQDVGTFRSNLNAKASESRKKRIVKDSSLPSNNSIIVHFNSQIKVEQVLGNIAGLSYVLDVTLNKLISASNLPNDRYVDSNRDGVLDYNASKNLPWAWHYTAIGAEQARAQTGKGVVVAVIDDGLVEMATSSKTNYTALHNPELSGQFWVNPGEIPNDGIDNDRNGYVDDINGANIIADEGCKAKKLNCNSRLIGTPWSRVADYHGVAVASLIAAKANNGIGMAGIADGVKIMGVKVLDAFSNSVGDETYKSNNATTLAMGILYAVRNGADVINMSLGGEIANLLNQEYTVLRDAIRLARDSGVIVVAAAGNSAKLGSTMYPGAFDEVISVASSNYQNQISGFSNHGSTVDLTAPGDLVSAMVPSMIYGQYSNPYSAENINRPELFAPVRGTSFSSPLVAGTIALMLEKNPALKQEEIVGILKQTATPINGNSKGIQGGIINIKRALNSVQGPVTQGLGYKTNPANKFDVTNDGYVTPMDALALINAINSGGAGNSNYFYDVNGDGYLSALDVLTVINYINSR